MKAPSINWNILAIAFLYWLIETASFGWNWMPGSPAEILADGIALVLVAMAIAFPPRQVPRIQIRRVVGKNGESKGLFIIVDGSIQILEAEDLHA